MKASLRQRLESLHERFDELAALLAEPDVIADQARFRDYSREYAELGELIEAWREFRATESDVESAEQLTGDVARLSLWDDDEAWREAETTMDELNARFGDGSVRSAALLRGARTRRFGHGD